MHVCMAKAAELSLVPRPSLTAFFAAVEKSAAKQVRHFMSKKPAGNYSSEILKAQFSNRRDQASYSCIIGILRKVAKCSSESADSAVSSYASC